MPEVTLKVHDKCSHNPGSTTERNRQWVTEGRPILMYHSVSRLTPDPNMVCTSPERFEEQMLYLKRRGLRGVAVRDLLRAEREGEAARLVGLTFDDGYRDFLTEAVPIMESFGFQATVFAVVGKVENDWEHAYPPRPRMQLLSAEELRRVSRRAAWR